MEQLRVLQGVSVPRFMYGTAWKEDKTKALTCRAIEAGFVAIDTANQRRHYVEAAVGEAVAEAIASHKVRREDLFLQTKFTYVAGQDHRLPYDPDASYTQQVQQSFASSLQHLHTTYLDSYVLHGPHQRQLLSEPDREVWRAMEGLLPGGDVRLLGVSIVNFSQLKALWETAPVKPAFVQNRCYARRGWDQEVRAFCRKHDIAYQGFSLLTANAKELNTPEIGQIAKRVGRTPAQVVFRFALQVGMMPLTGTSSPEHMRQDLGAFDFALTAQEMATLESISSTL